MEPLAADKQTMDVANRSLSSIELMASSVIWMCKEDDPEYSLDTCASNYVLETIDEELELGLAADSVDGPALTALQQIQALRKQGFPECTYEECYAYDHIKAIVAICQAANQE